MTRRIAVTLALLLASGAGRADAAARWGLSLGGQLTQMTTESSAGVSGHPMSFTGSGGGIVEWGLPNRFSFALEPGLSWITDRQDVTFGVPGFESRSIAQFRSAVVPATLAYEFAPRWRVRLGPEVRFRIHATQELEGGGLLLATSTPGMSFAQIFEFFGTGGRTDVTDAYEPVSLGVLAGVGYAFPVGGHELRTDLRWSEGASSLLDTTYGTRRVRALQLVLGWMM